MNDVLSFPRHFLSPRFAVLDEKGVFQQPQALALIKPSMSEMAIFHQLGSGVPVNPFAKSELLY